MIHRRAWWLVILLVTPSIAAGQETRADDIAAEQAQKAKRVAPYEPGAAERWLLTVKNYFLAPNGVYPLFDSVYGGGGLTGGAGYRQFIADRTFFNARGLLSIKEYKLAEVSVNATGLSQGRVDVSAVGGWRDATQVAFYGVGGDTAPEDKSNYRMQQGYVGAAVHARGPGKTVADAAAYYEDYTLKSGIGTSPSIEQLYTSSTAPGLGAEPAFFHFTLGGGVDTRPARGYARTGGFYGVAYDAFIDTDDEFTFDRFQAEVVQHIPVLRENWVISLHAVARTTIDDDDAVPYFLLPSLGSGSTLRAYPSWRFRDRHSLLLAGEWRWIPNRTFLDMAFFYDAGKVTSRREDLDFSGLQHGYGVGIRFHTPAVTPLRIDVAHGGEGFNVVFSGAAPF